MSLDMPVVFYCGICATSKTVPLLQLQRDSYLLRQDIIDHVTMEHKVGDLNLFGDHMAVPQDQVFVQLMVEGQTVENLKKHLEELKSKRDVKQG